MKLQAFIALGAATIAASAYGVIIDEFDTDQIVIAASGSDASSAKNGVDMIGGEREIYARNVFGMGNLKEVSNAATAGKLDFSLDSMTIGQGKLVWDGDDNDDPNITSGTSPDWTNGMVEDLTESGSHDKLCVTICGLDLPTELYFRIWDTSGNSASLAQTIPGGILSDTDYFFDFADFLAVNASLDLTQVGAIKMLIQPEGDNTDLTIEVIKTVPTPGAFALVGFAGLLGVRRRR